jgi:hypothetical protein
MKDMHSEPMIPAEAGPVHTPSCSKAASPLGSSTWGLGRGGPVRWRQG